MASSTNSLLNDMNTLSSSVVANLKLMDILNSKTKEIMSDTDHQAERLLKNHEKYSENHKKKCLSNIQAQFDRSKELCDDKVLLSIQTYELVDKQIRMLDTEMDKLKINIEKKSSLLTPKYTKIESNTVKKEKNMAFDDLTQVNDFSKLSSHTENKQCSLETFNASYSVVYRDMCIPELALDMPVDPNEPVYCFCQQVSFGEMIMCDDPKCSIEWFHFECVNLNKKPKGNWFCPNCSIKTK